MIKWIYSGKKTESGTGFDYPKKNVWVFGVDLTDSELEVLKKDFKLTGLKKFSKEKMPKVHSQALSFTFVDYYVERNEIKRTNIYYAVGNDYLVTVFENPPRVYNDFFESYKGRKTGFSSVDVLYDLLFEDVNDNYNVLEALEERIANLQTRIVGKKRLSEELGEIVQLKKSISEISKVFWHSIKIMFTMKKTLSDVLQLTEKQEALLDELYSTYDHQLDLISKENQMLTDAISIAQANISNTTNISIRRLTLVTMILTGVSFVIAVPNTLATILGIPYFSSHPNYALLIVLLILVSALIPTIWFYLYWKKVIKEVG